MNLISKLLVVALLCGVVFAIAGALPVQGNSGAAMVPFQIMAGDGVRTIGAHLEAQHLIRSGYVFDVIAAGEGKSQKFSPGVYEINASMSTPTIVGVLGNAMNGGVSVTFPEGVNLFQMDDVLSSADITPPRAFANYALANHLEGYLFPDTYRFFKGEPMTMIAQAFSANFAAKAVPVLAGDAHASDTVTLASILEKEVRTDEDRRIVAGILEKRTQMGIPLGVDAAVCYGKQLAHQSTTISCADLVPADFKLVSPYNTYLNKDLPPGPIGNPGIAAFTAARQPATSSYLFYITDPATGKTVYAKTLQEQEKNIKTYLK